jgi:bifunctional UDP-N-acetylglucosamine pyrophosphorylase / glucosamine-1-phosphate N-acetyltransferase
VNIVILAAGLGKRMHSDMPKVLHPLAGRPLLSHVLDTAQQLSPKVLCVVVGHGAGAVRDATESKHIVWVEQKPQLGTGHALMQAAPHLDDRHPTLVLYGDVPLLRAETLRRLVRAAGKGLGLLTVTVDDPAGYGRVIRSHGKIARIVEEKDATAAQRAQREIYTGIMLAPTKPLKVWLAKLKNRNAQKEYYLTDVVALAAADRTPVAAVQPEAPWETLGVNSRGQLAELEHVARRNAAAALLDQGVTLADPARCDVRGHLTCGRDVALDVNCVFEGEVGLGARVSVGANCVLKNVKVAAGTRIEPFCHIEDADIGAGCRIGPYARIRPGTRLAKNVHLGNFVEVKASSIGADSKANHLSYIGDSTVGKNVNVGAGTITCNYDGASKHRTVSEDDVFIGSDTQLVAPVRVGKGATLGAGTTLTKDAPAGELTISRARQVTVTGWKRPAKK